MTDKPIHYCECGCGAVTGYPPRGRFKDTPYRFINGHGRRRTEQAFVESFWDRVDRRGEDGCWIWKGRIADTGYGELNRLSRTRNTHVVAYELTYGPVPDGMCVLHKCDNRPCCNPSHLFLGTKKDNTQDMMRKDRWRNQFRRD